MNGFQLLGAVSIRPCQFRGGQSRICFKVISLCSPFDWLHAAYIETGSRCRRHTQHPWTCKPSSRSVKHLEKSESHKSTTSSWFIQGSQIGFTASILSHFETCLWISTATRQRRIYSTLQMNCEDRYQKGLCNLWQKCRSSLLPGWNEPWSDPNRGYGPDFHNWHEIPNLWNRQTSPILKKGVQNLVPSKNSFQRWDLAISFLRPNFRDLERGKVFGGVESSINRQLRVSKNHRPAAAHHSRNAVRRLAGRYYSLRCNLLFFMESHHAQRWRCQPTFEHWQLTMWLRMRAGSILAAAGVDERGEEIELLLSTSPPPSRIKGTPT